MAQDVVTKHSEEASAPYPPLWEVDALLLDGEPIEIRPVRPDDGTRLAEFHRELGTATVYYRYFGIHTTLTETELARLVGVDYRSRMAFFAFASGRLVGVGRYEQDTPGSSAEMAFVVADDYQRRGIGTLLLESLVAYGAEQGVGRFTAEVLRANPAMLRVFRESGLTLIEVNEDDVVKVTIDPTPTPEYLDRRDERERAADAASVAFLLRPSSVAVVGAGRAVGGVGHAIVRALLAGDFAGPVYPVNPHARSICGVLAYPSLMAVPERLDLAVVAVQAAQVLGVAEDAAAAGVRTLVVVSSGFAELGEAGRTAQTDLLRLARQHGMRIVGPNCLGACNTAGDIRMNATFAPVAPVPGPIALASQSGAVGVVLLEQARKMGLGISSFVSVGNKIDVSGNDLLAYWERDDATEVIALYLESFGNPRKFARVARRVASKKPIVVLKGGKSAAGARGARSHTAAAATPEVATHALLSGSGVIEVSRLEEMFAVVGVLAYCPLPKGRRVALVGNSGGPLILAADACASEGLTVPELASETQAALATVLPPASAAANPVDLTADGGAEVLERALDLVLADTEIDAVIVVITSLISLSISDARRALERVVERAKKPVIACLLGDDEPLAGAAPSHLAVVGAPERAANALAHAAEYAAWMARPAPLADAPSPSGNVGAERAVVTAGLATDPSGGWLDSGEVGELLRAFGVPLVESAIVSSADEALAAAQRIGYPVVLKAGSTTLVHKSDVGGVALGLDSPEHLTEAFTAMAARLGSAMLPAVIQSMATGGVETIVGMTSDHQFGPLLLFGLGGVTTDLLGDRAFAVPPLSVDDADRLLSSIRSAPLLHGYRGSAPVDTGALRDVVLAISRLATDLPEIAELDLNPVIVSPSGATVVDAKVRVAPVPRGPDALMRVLRG
jgi:acyl-CoA synthetase (NDP forming)/RimJ/RimL family protein N-acetyltransferase